jgi:hypothetical protein
MGNIKTTIELDMKQLDELIIKGQFDEAKKKFIKSENSLKSTSSEEKKSEITNYLLEYLDQETRKYLKNYIWNLYSSDRIYLIFKEIYEEKLIKSCEFQISSLSKENEIESYIQKLEKVFIMIGLPSKVGVINERLSQLYYKLVDIKFQQFQMNPQLDKIEEIIKLQEKSIQYIKQTINTEQKIECEGFLEILLNEKYKLYGIECQKNNKYEEAIEYYEKITKMTELILDCIEKCYEEIVLENERSKKYEKALNALGKLHNNENRIKIKKVELKMKLLYQQIEKLIEQNNYFPSLDLYYDLLEFKIENNLDEKYFESDFEKYTDLFISNLINITLYSFKENKFPEFISKLEEKSKQFTKQKILIYVNDLLDYLKKIEKDKNILSLENITKILLSKEKLSEINQRIFLSFLIKFYLNNENKQNILETLNNSSIDFIYINDECKNILYTLLEKEDINNTNMILSISKIIHKICIKDVQPSFTLFKIVGLKIKKLNENKGTKVNLNYYDTIKLLMKIFQNVILKSNFSMKDPIIIYTNLLYNLDKIQKDVIKGLISFLQYKDNEKLDKNTTYFFINYITSKNEEINNLLETILKQIKLQKNIEKDLLLLLFRLLIFYKKEKNDLASQEKIIKLLIDENIDKKVLTDIQVKKIINEYLKLGNNCSLIIDFIYTHNKIPEDQRTFEMNEAYNNYIKNQNVKIGNQNKREKEMETYQIKNILKMSKSINEKNQSLIEEKLDDADIAKEYLSHLKSSNDLFKTMNLKNVSKHFNKNNIEIFELICQKKKEWPEKALINLLNGFYKEDPILIKETFRIFNLIEEYQPLPEIILKNIEIEKKLSDETYFNLKKEDKLTYEEMLDEFGDLHGFSKRHKKFINQFNKFSFDGNNNIYIKFINLITIKNFDIGKNIFIKSIEKVDLDFFSKIYSKIISNPLINLNYKSYVLNRLDKELKNESNLNEQIIQLIYQIKYFIDWIILAPKFINTFYDMLTKYFEDLNTKKELIFSIGNYFSTKKENQKDLFIKFKDLLQNEPIYQKLDEINVNKFNEEELFYIYSCAQYYDKDDLNNPEEIPTQVIAKYIFEHQQFYEYKEIIEKIEEFSKRLNFGKFSPERDNSLRQLFLSQDPKSLDYLEIIS